MDKVPIWMRTENNDFSPNQQQGAIVFFLKMIADRLIGVNQQLQSIDQRLQHLSNTKGIDLSASPFTTKPSKS